MKGHVHDMYCMANHIALFWYSKSLTYSNRIETFIASSSCIHYMYCTMQSYATSMTCVMRFIDAFIYLLHISIASPIAAMVVSKLKPL